MVFLGCVYNNFNLEVGESFFQGCQSKCTCIARGEIRCVNRCPSHFKEPRTVKKFVPNRRDGTMLEDIGHRLDGDWFGHLRRTSHAHFYQGVVQVPPQNTIRFEQQKPQENSIQFQQKMPRQRSLGESGIRNIPFRPLNVIHDEQSSPEVTVRKMTGCSLAKDPRDSCCFVVHCPGEGQLMSKKSPRLVQSDSADRSHIEARLSQLMTDLDVQGLKLHR